MKKLGIKGHSTRGKEVMELLEMMGGKNSNGFICSSPNRFYYILNEYFCLDYIDSEEINEYVIFTLEEFLEKYPFKVGDKVEVCGTNKVFTIGNMIWEDELCTVYYANMEDIEYYTAKELKPYKETNMKDNTTLNMSAIDYNNGLVGYEIPKGYEFDIVIDNKVVLKKLKPTYPKTVIEVLDYWYPNREPEDDYQCIYKKELIKSFQLLLYCRDAYWKIAGEEMGLDKPWEPHWNSGNPFYCISVSGGVIGKGRWYNDNKILAFPTEKMRDAFYENFKDLIEQCKELL